MIINQEKKEQLWEKYSQYLLIDYTNFGKMIDNINDQYLCKESINTKDSKSISDRFFKISYRIGNLELRNTIIPPSSTPSFYFGIEVVQWERDNSGNNYCYTLVYWVRDREGSYELRFVRDRPFKADRDILWKLMEEGQKLIKEECSRQKEEDKC